MKTITTLALTVAFIGGIAVAHAQQMPRSQTKPTPTDQNEGAERNPGGQIGGSVNNPSPPGNVGGTTGAAPGASAPAPVAPGQGGRESGGRESEVPRIDRR